MQRAAVGFGVDGDRSDTHAAQRPNDATGDHAAIGDEDLAEHYGATATPGTSHTMTSTGVGLYALQGLFNCGQLLIRTRTSISARISTYLPGSEIPSSKVKPPSGVTG